MTQSTKPLDEGTHREMLSQTLEQVVDAIVVMDERGEVLLLSAGAQKFWGCSNDGVIGKHASMLFSQVQAPVDDRSAIGIPCVEGIWRDLPVRHSDGVQRWASVFISKVAVQGRILYTALVKDISQQKAQQERLQHLALVAEHSGSAIVVTGADRRIAYVNAGFTKLFGHESSLAVGQFPNHLLSGPHTEKAALDAVRDFAVTGLDLQIEALLYAKNGRPIWASLVMNPVNDERGHVEHIVAVITDITRTKMQEVLSHQVLDAMAHGASVREIAALLCKQVESIAADVRVAVLHPGANGALRTLAAPGVPNDLVVWIDQVFCASEAGIGATAAHTGQSVRSDDLTTDADWAPHCAPLVVHGLRACGAHPIMAGNATVLGVLVFFYREPTVPGALHEQLVEASLHLCALFLERARERQQLHHLTRFDALTGLSNRSTLVATTQQMLRDATGRRMPIAWVLVDLDRFKQFSEIYGHPVADALLRVVANRLKAAARDTDVLARVGADEFVLVLPQCNTVQAAAMAQRLRSVISVPVEVEGVTLHPRASIGIAMYPEDGKDAEVLLHSANVAMAQAKMQRGERLQFYSARFNKEVQEQTQLEADLRSALNQGGLMLHYQPVVDASGGVWGVEALLRWQHPTMGGIEPTRFVALAEERGLIDALSQWVATEACRQMADWRLRGIAVPHVAINLSPSNFRSGETPLMITSTVRRYGLQPGDLRVEVTETALLDPHPNTLMTARALHAHGVLLSLDDFGTGHSSLAALHRLPISTIKLDKSFIQDLEHSASARALAAAVQRIGASLGMPVIAEGVENEAQRRFLSHCGCGLFQGYFFSRPLPSQQLETWFLACGPSIPHGQCNDSETSPSHQGIQ